MQWNSSRALQNPEKGCCESVALNMSANLEEPSSGLRAGKCQSPSKFPRGVVLKNVPTIGQLHSTPMLIKSYLKSLKKMMLSKCCTQYVSNFGKLSSGHKTGKGHFHSNPKERQCQRMLKLLHNCTHLKH